MVVCPACDGENLDDARFCSQCGRALEVGPETCAACSAELPADARFCPACGAPREAAGDAERRLVTILFADIADSTPLGEALDPEDLKDVLGAYADAMRGAIEAEGGTVEKFIGDAVMAVFGAPVAHEDDAARALRAALRMRDRLELLNIELERRGVRLGMRVGVNTGEVVAARDARPEVGMITGDAVNAAARLEQNAERGQILVSERTARSAREFRFGALEPLPVKGKAEPIPTLELLGLGGRPHAGRDERGVPGLHAPMVGRDRELHLLGSLYERLAASGRAQLVTVYGDPGIGKSRLTREFVRWAEEQAVPPTVVRGRCLPYGESVTYWPLAEIVKAHTGVLDSDPPDAALAKIGTLADGVLATAPDPPRAAGALAFTFGLEDPRFGFAGLPPRQVRLETHDAWRAFFTGLAANGAVVAVIEDIHWADEALLDLLEDLADRVAGPLLFLCPARPDLAQRRQGWGGGKRNFSAIFLEPLSHDDAARLVEFLLAVEDLPEATREAMLERADGNPFFVEEIVRHLIDEGRIVHEQGRWRASEDIAEIVIPDTVQGVLAARIDLLPAEERRALRSAAVVGRVFWSGPVERLLNGDGHRLGEILGRLEDRELVYSQVGSTVAGEREFVFKHVLTRDVAYGTLSRRDRAAAHATVADWIESSAGGRQREFADLLAHHYREAYEGATADPASAPSDVADLREKALAALLAASAEARSRMLLEKADGFAQASLALATGSYERSLALEAAGLCALWDYRGDDAWRNLSEAVDERVASSRDSGEALAMLCARAVESPTRWPASMESSPDQSEVARYLEIGLENAAAVGEARIRLLIARSMWTFAFRRVGFTRDEADAGRAAGEEAFSLAEALGRDDLASAALDGVASIDFIVGHHGRNWPVLERRLVIAERLTDPWEIGDALQTAADTALAVGRYPAAERWANEGFERARGGPDVWRSCLAWRAIARFELGKWDAAVQDFELMEAARATTRFGSIGYFTVTMWGCIALLEELRGERGRAEGLAARVASTGSGSGTIRTIPWLARLRAHQGSEEAFTVIEHGRSLVGRDMGRGALLEALCDVVADAGRWELASATVAEARAFAEEAKLEALVHHADRLEGRAALAAGDPAPAVDLLERASAGFGRLGGLWKHALSELWLSEARLTARDVAGARASAEASRDVFEVLGAGRELDQARSLLGRTV